MLAKAGTTAIAHVATITGKTTVAMDSTLL